MLLVWRENVFRPLMVWGGKGRQGEGSSIAARLILMCVWCDSTQPTI